MPLPEDLTAPVTPHEPHRFVALDALRGVAALSVIGLHQCPAAFPHGYLAVDFFFLLSGFVMTFAYQNKLDAGNVSTFARARVIRLYPLYLLGLLLGIALALVKYMLHFPEFPLRTIAIAASLGTFLLPAALRIGGRPTDLFPVNPAAWSLFFEALANVFHALFYRRRGVRALAVVIALSGLSLLYVAFTNQDLDHGAHQATALWGISRCIFSYSVGVCLCIFWKRDLVRRSMPVLLTLLVLTASFLVSKSFRGNAFYDLLMIAAVYPCLLWFSIGTVIQGAWRRIVNVLAESSYAIYIMHMPLLGFLALAWNRLSHHRALPVMVQILFAMVITVIATAADHFYDRPLRRALAGLRGRSPRVLSLARAAAAQVSQLAGPSTPLRSAQDDALSELTERPRP